MKFRTALGAVALAIGLAIPASAPAQSTIEQIAADILGQQFGIPVREIVELSRQSQQNPFDLAPVLSTAHHTHRSANEVSRLREQGLGWGEIAHRLGMHPGTFNKLRKEGAFDRDKIWDRIAKDRYGLSDADLEGIRKHGGSVRDVLPAAIIGKAKRISPVSAYDRYRKDGDWARTAKSYGVDLRREGMKGGKSEVAPPGKGKGNAGGNGKAKGKGGGNGKAKGKGGG